MKATSKAPLAFPEQRFGSPEQISSWFGDFSQGKGEEGKALYRQCDGSCSPSYTTSITKKDDAFVLLAKVVCGHARDKEDNLYELGYAYRWRCQPQDAVKR